MRIIRDYYNELNGKLSSMKINNFIDDVLINLSDLDSRLDNQNLITNNLQDIISLQNQVNMSGIYADKYFYVDASGEYNFYFDDPRYLIPNPDSEPSTTNYWSSSVITQTPIGTINYSNIDSLKLYEYDASNSTGYYKGDQIDLTNLFNNGFLIYTSPTSTAKFILDLNQSYAESLNQLNLEFFPIPGIRPIKTEAMYSSSDLVEISGGLAEHPMINIPINIDNGDGVYLGTTTKLFKIEVPTVNIDTLNKVGIRKLEAVYNTYKDGCIFKYNIKFYMTPEAAYTFTGASIIGIGNTPFYITDSLDDTKYTSSAPAEFSYVTDAAGLVDLKIIVTLNNQYTETTNNYKYTREYNTSTVRGIKFTITKT